MLARTVADLGGSERIRFAAVCLALVASLAAAAPMSTAFTYQGA